MHKKPLTKAKMTANAAARHRRRRRATLILTAVLLLLATAVTITVVNRGRLRTAYENRGLVRLTLDEEDRLTGKKGTVVLEAAPFCFEPTEIGSAAAYYETARETVRLYRVGEQDPSLWLADEYIGTGTVLFHATAITLPTLQTLAPTMLRVCDSTYGDPLEIHCCQNTALIGQLITLFTTGEQTEIPFFRNTKSLDLKFYSPDWPMLYYNLSYYECDDGGYVFDRSTRQCVAVGDLLLDYTS